MDIRQEKIEKKEGWAEKVSCLTCRIACHPKTPDRFPYLHYHEYFELLYGLSGEAVVSVGNRVCTMKKGDLIIVNAKEIHDVQCETGKSASYYVIKFLPAILYTHSQSLSGVRYLLPMWQKEISYSPVVTAQELKGSEIGPLIHNVMREWEQQSVGFELMMQANIIHIFVWMLRNRCPASALTADLPQGLHQVLQGVLEATQSHLTDWTARDAADFCNLSYSYFSRNFKKAYGISFSSYLETLRLQEGERLLLTTDREVTDIAASLNFATTSYFIERFRLRYGTSPRLFRHQMRAQRE